MWEWVSQVCNLDTLFWFIVNKQLKKYAAPLLRLVGSTLCFPSDIYVRSFVSFFTIIKLLSHEVLSVWSLNPGPEAKSSSLEIRNLTPFTVNYHTEGVLCLWRAVGGWSWSVGGHLLPWLSYNSSVTSWKCQLCCIILPSMSKDGWKADTLVRAICSFVMLWQKRALIIDSHCLRRKATETASVKWCCGLLVCLP